jgi:hypothetical protein
VTLCSASPWRIEEIEALGRRERQELINRLGVLLWLKWELQPEKRFKSWLSTIREQRRKIIKLLSENPSLKPCLNEACEEAHEAGIDLVIRETTLGCEDLPQSSLYTVEQLLDNTFSLAQI